MYNSDREMATSVETQSIQVVVDPHIEITTLELTYLFDRCETLDCSYQPLQLPCQLKMTLVGWTCHSNRLTGTRCQAE